MRTEQTILVESFKNQKPLLLFNARHLESLELFSGCVDFVDMISVLSRLQISDIEQIGILIKHEKGILGKVKAEITKFSVFNQKNNNNSEVGTDREKLEKKWFEKFKTYADNQENFNSDGVLLQPSYTHNRPLYNQLYSLQNDLELMSVYRESLKNLGFNLAYEKEEKLTDDEYLTLFEDYAKISERRKKDGTLKIPDLKTYPKIYYKLQAIKYGGDFKYTEELTDLGYNIIKFSEERWIEEFKNYAFDPNNKSTTGIKPPSKSGHPQLHNKLTKLRKNPEKCSYIHTLKNLGYNV